MKKERRAGSGTDRERVISDADKAGMAYALDWAKLAGSLGEVPVGAVVTLAGEVIAGAHNEMAGLTDPTAHAELLAVQRALRIQGIDRLTDCTLYVTLEPCGQCAGAIVLAKVGRVVFGAYDDKAGMAGSVGDLLRHARLNHNPEVIGGVEEKESARLLRAFFTARR